MSGQRNNKLPPPKERNRGGPKAAPFSFVGCVGESGSVAYAGESVAAFPQRRKVRSADMIGVE